MPEVTNNVTQGKPLISVCICTYQRPAQLEQLLTLLHRQVTDGLFELSIVVVDNDARESARRIVESQAEQSALPIVYRVEPRQNIAIARNASVAVATGELVAFVDDDEEPSDDWLLRLYGVLIKHGADGVFGPVLPKFEQGAPNWAVKGQIFRRARTFETGALVPWSVTCTCNALVRREVLLQWDRPFDPKLGAGGEDVDFFRRAISRGRVFVWSAEAVCRERVPPERTRIGFQLRRALLRGKVASRGTAGGWRGIVKSAIAVPIYVAALPVCLLIGSHVFVEYLVKTFDHLGKLLGICRIELVGDKYITQ